MPQAPKARSWSTPKQYTMILEKFRGVDLTSSVVNVDPSRSPDAPNLMPDADGYPAKRPGWHTLLTLTGTIHGAYALSVAGSETRLVHAGTTLYKLAADMASATAIYTDMADAPSHAVQYGSKLWIVDGKTYLYCDGTKAEPVTQIATVPQITTAKAPNGTSGATSNMPINLLTGKRTDSYAGLAATAAATEYYLSYNGLTAAALDVEILTAKGVWTKKTEGTDYTVDRTLGKVTFVTAPGKSVVDGEDNVRITYEVTASHADKINGCKYSILYGVNGAMDRIFLAGNTAETNIDYWSNWSDPAYIGDTWYGQIGQSAAPIMGYSILGDSLVTHKKNEENGRNAFVRTGSLDSDGFAVFKLTNVIQGEGVVSGRGFGSLNSEPLFLTARGVQALTPSDITGERYAQGRSWYINGALQKLDLSDAPAVIFGRFYALAAGGRIYLLDSARKSYESKAPQSEYQYDAWYWTGVAPTALWSWDGVLCFGDAAGNVRQFYAAAGTAAENDDGAAIEAYWTTPLLPMGTWGNLKTVTGVWVTLQPYSRSSGEIWYATDKEYEKLVRSTTMDIFNWDDIDFDRWTFNTLDRPAIVPARKKAKKVKLFQVKVRNAVLAEPFGLDAIQIQYRIGGKVKR